jgi:two-component sensor histidine kinase
LARHDNPHFLDGGGEAGAAIMAFDWSATPLGPMAQWPAALRTTVSIMVSSSFPKCLFWGPHRITFYNDAYRPILGEKPEALGQPMAEVWPEIADQIEPMIDAAMAGRATFIEDHPLLINRHGYPEQCWFTFCYSPVRDADGEVLGMLNTVIETTAKVEAERNARLLNEELAHRIKNTLAIVSAIAHQSYRSASSKDAAHTLLTQRLVALGRAHSVLTQSSWHGAPIEYIITNALTPHITRPEQVEVSGPPTMLSPKQALSLSLALHELATNALKYGALSRDSGRIRINWIAGKPESDEPFCLTWTESGGPPVTAPRRRGFGTRLINSSLAQDFDGKVTLEFRPEGLSCILEARMASLRIDD